MKTKRLVILLSIFALLIVIVVLSSTLFSLSKVEVAFMEVPTNFSISNSQEIIDSGEFNFNQSIFLVNKSKHTANIESKFPKLKVISIETKFPNKLVIQVVERQEFLALYNFENDNYFVVDGDMKVLRIADELAVTGIAKLDVILE